MSIKERVFKKESLDRYLSEDGKFNKTLRSYLHGNRSRDRYGDLHLAWNCCRPS